MPSARAQSAQSAPASAAPSDAKAADAQEKAAPPAAPPAAASAADQQPWKRIAERIAALEGETRQQAWQALDAQRKTIDWWFGYLAVFTAVLGLVAVIIPFLMGRRDRELMALARSEMAGVRDEAKHTKTEAERLLAQADAAVRQIDAHKDGARQSVVATQQSAEVAKQIVANMSGDPAQRKPEEAESEQAAVKAVLQDPSADPASKLRAEALAAGDQGEFERAYDLWKALTHLQPDDSNVHFNAGYAAQKCSDDPLDMRQSHWWKLAREHYESVNFIHVDAADALNNSGATYNAEAVLLSKSDPGKALRLWKKAGEKYEAALDQNPGHAIVAFNWINALLRECDMVFADNPAHATSLLDQATELVMRFSGSHQNETNDYTKRISEYRKNLR
jgi:hypothetical protein